MEYALNCYYSKWKWWFYSFILISFSKVYFWIYIRFGFVKHQDASVDPLEIIALISQLSITFLSVFCICDLGERVRTAFDEIEMMLDQLKWYLVPKGTRKMLSIIFMAFQRPVEITIFGSISCDRITFKLVSSTSLDGSTRNFLNHRISLSI